MVAVLGLDSKFGDINCLEVGIWVELLQSEDGHRQLWNVIKEGATAKGVFTEISSADLLKSAK